jgi:hypothetical protein
VESQATPFPAAIATPGRAATPPIISWPEALSTGIDVQLLPSRECQAIATTSVGLDPRLLPMATRPPLPSSEMPWATKRRLPTSKAPDAERCVQVAPSVEAQTVVVEPVVPSMSMSGPYEAK